MISAKEYVEKVIEDVKKEMETTLNLFKPYKKFLKA